MRLSREQVGILAAAGAAVLFGLSFPITVFALRSFTPLGTAAISCSIAFVVVALLAALGVVPRPTLRERSPGNAGRLAFVALIGGLCFILCANVAISLSGATIAGFVSSLYAVLATLFAIPILGERVRQTVIVALFVSLLGTALLAGFAPVGGSALGIGFGVIAAISFGLYLVFARRWGPTHGLTGTTVVLALLFGRGPILLAVELVREPASLLPSNPDPAALLAMAYLAIGPMIVAQFFIVASVARVPARRTSASLLLTPLCAAIGAYILLGDRLTPIELVGAGLLLLGIAVASGLVDGIVQRLRQPVSLTLSEAAPYNPDEITRD